MFIIKSLLQFNPYRRDPHWKEPIPTIRIKYSQKRNTSMDFSLTCIRGKFCPEWAMHSQFTYSYKQKTRIRIISSFLLSLEFAPFPSLPFSLSSLCAAGKRFSWVSQRRQQRSVVFLLILLNDQQHWDTLTQIKRFIT